MIIRFVEGDEVVHTVGHEGNDYLMWEATGLYLDDPHLQYPEVLETDVVYALYELKRDPGHYKLYNGALVGSTTYESVLHFLEKVQKACQDFPGTRVEVEGD